MRYWDDNGKVRHVSTGTKLKSQAQEVLNSFKGLTKGDPETIILKHLKVNQYAPKTIEKYQYVFKVIKSLGKVFAHFTLFYIFRYFGYYVSVGLEYCYPPSFFKECFREFFLYRYDSAVIVDRHSVVCT